MSEPEVSMDEELLPPNFFSDDNSVENRSTQFNCEESTSMSAVGIDKPESMCESSEWKGVSMDTIRKGLGIYECQECPPIIPSTSHTVLFRLPLPSRGPPDPYPSQQIDKWNQDYVRMPHSIHSLYPVDEQDGSCHCRNRWEIIQESLLQKFVSSHQLETAILSYNHIYASRWDFVALHKFFSEMVEEEEASLFFEGLLPKMIQLALQLPTLITGPIPLLKRYSDACISLSQLQVASLLANAFFCTFPKRNSSNPQSEYATFPHINFNRLFSAFKQEKLNRCHAVMEKLKCIFHYFRRVTTKAPEGVITIRRRYISKRNCPKWDRLDQKLLPLHITSKGTIEDGAGLLQVDFANKYVGGGVLGFGSVQEEIRFVICPELMITMLVTEVLDDTEALVITGVERYSNYEGYSNNFKWAGNYVDETPRDSNGRRMTSVVAIDALRFGQQSVQFGINKIIRELNKAYVGFASLNDSKDNLLAVATGNWGCGAFRGNPKLKILLQLMAASVAGRSLVYFTFGDKTLRDDAAAMYWHLVQGNTSIAHLFSLLSQYQKFATTRLDFYDFLYKKTKMNSFKMYINVKNENTKIEYSTPRNIKSPQFSQKSDMQKQYICHNVKEDTTVKKDNIEKWLADINESDPDNNITIEENNASIRKYSNGQKEDYNCRNEEEEMERKKKKSFWKLQEDKTFINNSCEKKLSGLDALDIKQISTSNFTDCDSITVIQKSCITNITNDSSNHEVTRQCPFKSSKQNYLSKKGNQRKISDFFQRTS